LTAGEAVVLRDGSWAATLAASAQCALVRAQCMKPSRLATLFACLLGLSLYCTGHARVFELQELRLRTPLHVETTTKHQAASSTGRLTRASS
jgi:hypothetical protein